MGRSSDLERNLKLVIEYDGTGLAGWQRQPDRPSVQGFLEAAVHRLTGEESTVIGAGRTDAGVHARGQVAHFKTWSGLPPDVFLRGLNALLPDAISVKAVDEVPLDFHARYHAVSKIYDYDLYLKPTPSALNRLYAWHIPFALDLEDMARALERLRGEQDFASFQSTGSQVAGTVRRMMDVALVPMDNGLVRITLQANGFLRHMVRSIVGTLVDVGRGRMTWSGIEAVVDARDRARAGATAPAHGLCLREVRY